MSYSAIIIRVGLGIAERSDGVSMSIPSASMQLASRSRQQALATHTDIPLRVTVTQHVENDAKDDVESGIAEDMSLAKL
jgi:hypothetical protein